MAEVAFLEREVIVPNVVGKVIISNPYEGQGRGCRECEVGQLDINQVCKPSSARTSKERKNPERR